MSEYTKGPGIVRKTGQHWNNPNLEGIEINYGSDNECICDTVYRIEDAHLIAAAPDMLEALELMVKHFENEDESVRCMDNNVLHLANEAIAKVKEENQ